MKRVVVLGPGGAGKSTLARRMGESTGLPVIELDKSLWQPGLVRTPRDAWVAKLRELIAGERWILDGDLGPYDAVEVRLAEADTVVLLDFPFWRCAWRSLRRSRERIDFWWWLLGWGWRSRPRLMRSVAAHAPSARLHILRNPRQVSAFLESVDRSSGARLPRIGRPFRRDHAEALPADTTGPGASRGRSARGNSRPRADCP